MDRLLPQLAAIVLISSFFTGPVTQQVLGASTELRPSVVNGTASAARVTTMSRTVSGAFKPGELESQVLTKKS